MMPYSDGPPVIIGAGPGGLVCALTLAQLGVPSLVLEKHRFPRDKVCGDAFSGKTLAVLASLNENWRKEIFAQPFQLASWGVRFVPPSGKAVDVPFRSGYDPAQAPVGFVAPRLEFDAWLLEKARANSLITIQEDAQVTQCVPTRAGLQLELKSGKEIEAPVVVGASGANGLVAKRMAGQKLDAAHHAASVRGYYSGVEGLHPHGFIELHFLREALPGYLWLFPMANGLANVGIGLRSDVAARRRTDLKKLLPELLEKVPAFRERFRNATPVGGLKGCGLPLGSLRRKLAGERFLLVGDEGGLIDPFTGEGIGNAMLSGRTAARHVAKAIKTRDFSEAALSAYEQEVYAALGSELRIGTQLQRLTRYPWLLNLVMGKADRSPELRDTITAMFENADLRGRFRDPRFYLKILFA